MVNENRTKMKRFFTALYVLLILNSCTSSLKDNYSGYIWNDRKPVKKAKIIDLHNTSHYTFTDEKGYFQLKRKNYSINSILIQLKEEIDTINLIRKSGAGAKPYILFLREDVIDTLYLDKERLFKKQSSNK
jgi:hypothetical protein